MHTAWLNIAIKQTIVNNKHLNSNGKYIGLDRDFAIPASPPVKNDIFDTYLIYTEWENLKYQTRNSKVSNYILRYQFKKGM